jgi:hypothetical protein
VRLEAPRAELDQGDLIALAPSVYVKSLAYMVRLDQNTYAIRRQKPQAFDETRRQQQNVREVVLDLTEGERDMPPMDGGDRFGNAVGARRFGLVIDHGCEVDKEDEPRVAHVAQVKPLQGVHEDDRESITSYHQKRMFYLPASGPLGEDHYADFRFITTLTRGAVDELGKIASMNDDGRLLLHYQLFRFFARKRLPDGWTEWPDEAEEEP